MRCSGSYLLVCFFVFLLNRLFVELQKSGRTLDGQSGWCIIGGSGENSLLGNILSCFEKERMTPDAAQKTGM